MSRPGDWARSAALLCVSLVLCAAALEGALRWIEPPKLATSQDFRVPDRLLGWRPEPGARFVYHPDRRLEVEVAYNSSGFRDVEHARAKPPGARRAVVLGDSFMEAYSVALDDSFARRLEREMRAQRMPLEVVNLGIGGFGSLQQLLLLEREGLDWQPDLVLLGFFASNDLADNSAQLSAVVGESHGMKRVARPFVDAAALPDLRVITPDFAAAQRRYLAQRERGAWRRFALPTAVRNARRALEERVAAWRDPAAFRRALRDRAVAGDGENLCAEPPEIRDAWRVTAAILARMREASARAGARLVVFYVPAATEVNPSAADGVRASLAGLGLGDTCVDAPAPPALRRVAGILDDLGIELVDLLPSFRAAASGPRGSPVFHTLDGHWNARGHAVAAREVARALRGEPSAAR